MNVYLLSDEDYDGGLWDVYATPEAAMAAVAKEYPGAVWTERDKASRGSDYRSWSAVFRVHGDHGAQMYLGIEEKPVLTGES